MLNPFAVFCFVFLSGRALVLLFFVSQCPLRSPQLCLLCLPLGRPYRHCVCLCIIQRPLSSRSLILATTKAAVAPRTAPHGATLLLLLLRVFWRLVEHLEYFIRITWPAFYKNNSNSNSNATTMPDRIHTLQTSVQMPPTSSSSSRASSALPLPLLFLTLSSSSSHTLTCCRIPQMLPIRGCFYCHCCLLSSLAFISTHSLSLSVFLPPIVLLLVVFFLVSST